MDNAELLLELNTDTGFGVTTSDTRRLLKITETKYKLTFTILYRKSPLKISLIKLNGDYIWDCEDVHIRCNRDTLLDEIKKLGGLNKLFWCQYRKQEKLRLERKAIRGKQIKEELYPILKHGDLVKRIGYTTINHYTVIQINNTDSSGVYGFYLDSNGNKTLEYTKLSWNYIKEIIKNED